MFKMKKLKKIPKFKTEKEEQEFWLTNDSTDYVDWSQAVRAKFPNLKRSTKTISLRLPESLLNNLKIMAGKRDVPYQSLMKIILSAAVRNNNI
jgi:predicted DNA binding CopG/RHH family protein